MTDVTEASLNARAGQMPKVPTRRFSPDISGSLLEADQVITAEADLTEVDIADNALGQQMAEFGDLTQKYLKKRAEFFDQQFGLEGDKESAQRLALLFELLPESGRMRRAFESGSRVDSRNLVLRSEFQDVRSHINALDSKGYFGEDYEERTETRRRYISTLVVSYAERRFGDNAEAVADQEVSETDVTGLIRKAVASTVVAVTLWGGPMASAMPAQAPTPTTQVAEADPSASVDARVQALGMEQAEIDKLKSLTPEMQGIALDIIEASRALEPSLDVHISYGARTPQEQAGLYAQGRTQDQVNARAAEMDRDGFSRLAAIQRAAQAQPGEGVVTNAAAGQSYHNGVGQGGLAFDVIIKLEDGQIAPSDSDVWTQYGALVASPRFSELVNWGGNFRSLADYGHVERRGVSITDQMRAIEAQLAAAEQGTVPETDTATTTTTSATIATPEMSVVEVQQQLDGGDDLSQATMAEAEGNGINYPEPLSADDYADIFEALARADAEAAEAAQPRGDSSSPGQLFEAHSEDFIAGAERLGIDPAVALGVFITESGGAGFGPDGRVKIRVETDNINEEYGTNVPDQHENGLPDSQEEEWQALVDTRRALEAIGEDPDHADEWTSWGGPQILGLHYETLGYRDVHAMELAFEDEGNQVAGFFAFVANMNQEAKDALRNGDYATFGYYYNGSWAYGDILARNIQQARQAIN